MTTTLENLDENPEPESAPLPDNPWMGLLARLRPRHVILLAIFGGLFLCLNYVPLRHTDLWGHVGIGQWIQAQGELPSQDPFMPLARGVRMVDTAWLAQVFFARIEHWGGAALLSDVFALVMLAKVLVMTRTYFIQSQTLVLSLAAVAVALGIGWPRLMSLRPETLGAVCFAVLLLITVSLEKALARRAQQGNLSSRWPLIVWVVTPLLFALWANLHGSFACGLAVLGCHGLGRVIQVGWQTRSVRAVVADPLAQQWLLLTELALAATLINPYGIDLLIETATFARNENLSDVREWYPLVLKSATGAGFGVGWALAMLSLRFSQRRVRPAEVLLFLLFSYAAVSSIRMIGWFAQVSLVVLVPHLSDIAGRIWNRRLESEFVPDNRPNLYVCVSCLFVIWVTFALSDLSRPLLGGKPRSVESLYTKETPLALTKYLVKNPPQGQIFNPQWWGDYLVLKGPPHLRVFVTSNIHLVPRQVWRDFLRVGFNGMTVEDTLNRYAVTTVVVDTDLQPLLVAAMRRARGWSLKYEDDQGMIWERAPRAEAGAKSAPEVPAEKPQPNDTAAKTRADTPSRATDLARAR